tara:strand:- start:9206 stop:9823 length:618 start_codon:yes stop_codon:yes gene_type:complete
MTIAFFVEWVKTKKDGIKLMISELYTSSEDKYKFSDPGIKSLQVTNAGGASELSEAVSIDIFVKMFQATDVVFEMEVKYDFYGASIVDYISTVGGIRVGISVTRAMGYPTASDYEFADAERLIYKKLKGLIVARNSVHKMHRFYHAVLHVLCQTPRQAKFITHAFQKLKKSGELVAIDNVLLLITIHEGPQADWLFYQKKIIYFL